MDFEYIVIRYAIQVICDQIWEKGTLTHILKCACFKDAYFCNGTGKLK